MASPDATPSFAEPYREAHLESVSPRTAPSTVSASALERLGAHLATDENFGRQLSKDAARALNGVNFLTDRERHLLAGLDKRAWGALVEASDKFKVAVGKRALAGVPGWSQLGDYLNGFKFGGGGSAYGWGDVKTPDGQGITTGSGRTVGGHVGGGATTGSASRGSDDGGRSGGSGHFGNYGGYTGHGNAGDPKSPGGGTIGGGPGEGGGGGSPFQDTADRYTGVGVHGDRYGGGGISGGNLPSRAVLAESAWKALHPGAEVAEGPNDPPKTPPGGSTPGPPKQVYVWPDGSVHDESPMSEMAEAVKWGVVGGAGVGLAAGAAFGKASPGAIQSGLIVGAFAGAIGGAVVGYGRTHGWWMPADTDLTGGSGGRSGPGGPRARALQLGQYYMPADDATGTSPTGPRSQVLRSLRSSAFYFPSEDAPGGPPGPRARSGPDGSVDMPAPDDPRPGNPHSRALAIAGIIPY